MNNYFVKQNDSKIYNHNGPPHNSENVFVVLRSGHACLPLYNLVQCGHTSPSHYATTTPPSSHSQIQTLISVKFVFIHCQKNNFAIHSHNFRGFMEKVTQ